MRDNKLNLPWIIRDWKTCFLACGFSLGVEEKPDTLCSSSPAQVRRRTLAFHFNKRHHRNKENFGHCEKNSQTTKEPIPSSDKSSLLKEPNFAEEDFIVFCLTKNGSFHVVNNDDNLTEASKHFNCGRRHSKSRTKLRDKENVERVHRCSNDCAKDERDSHVMNNEAGSNEDIERWSRNPNSTDGINRVEKDQIENGKTCVVTQSVEQSESNQSDGSSSSFAFPELNWEEIGSPKQMHTPDSLIFQQLEKHRTGTARVHSCRF